MAGRISVEWVAESSWNHRPNERGIRKFAESGIEGLSKSAPGPKSALSADAKRIAQLEKENKRLQEQLEIKEHCLALQKKALSLIEAFESRGPT